MKIEANGEQYTSRQLLMSFLNPKSMISFIILLLLIFGFNLLSCQPCIQTAKSKVEPSVVKLITDSGTGSGSIIDKAGYILTNYHVVEDSKIATVIMQTGTRYEGTVLCKDSPKDLAIIKVKDMSNEFPAAQIGNSDMVQTGDEIIVIGYPLGELSITRGIVSAIPTKDGMRYIQTDAAVNPGNSGGPMIKCEGKIIGVVSWKYRLTEGMAFAIPTNESKALINMCMNRLPLIISNIYVPDVTETTAIITWNTNRAADSTIIYGSTDSQGLLQVSSAMLSAQHRVTLINLRPNTTYNFKVRSKDEFGITVESDPKGIFTTRRPVTELPPKEKGKPATEESLIIVKEPSVFSITSSRATIVWATNKLASTHVQYGTTKYYDFVKEGDIEKTKEHIVTLNDLSPSTLYHYRVISRDEIGNEVKSDNLNFTTLQKRCPREGCLAPAFKFQTIDNKSLTSESLTGKKTMLMFFKTSCSTCMDQIRRFIQPIYGNWSRDDQSLIIVSSGETSETVNKALRTHDISIPILLDPIGENTNTYAVPVMPTTFFINNDGVIEMIKAAPFGSRQEIEAILKSLGWTSK